MKSAVNPASPVTEVAVNLQAGWNAVGLQAEQVAALSANPAVAGIIRWNGPAGYTSGNLSGVNSGGWVFATNATSFTYSASDPEPTHVDLPFNGYNLVGFGTSVDVPGSALTATQNGRSVPLSSVVLTQFTEIGANNQCTPVDVLAGGILKPGRAYWVVANTSNGVVRLHLPTASPSPAAPSLAVASLELTPINTTVKIYQTIQFTLNARLADGTSRDVTSLAQWSSKDPSVAALLSPGLFKGLNAFPTSVRATLNGLSAETDLLVEPPSGTLGRPATVNRFVGSFPAGQAPSMCPNIAGGLQTTFTSYPGFAFNYVMYPFTVPVTGTYNAEVTTETSANTGFFLRGRFSPGSPPATPLSAYFLACLSGTAPIPGVYPNMSLVAGEQYTFVVFYNNGAVAGEVSTFTITGPDGLGIITN